MKGKSINCFFLIHSVVIDPLIYVKIVRYFLGFSDRYLHMVPILSLLLTLSFHVH